MYKKTLLGLTLVWAASSVNAATLDTGVAVTHTIEGLQTAATTDATASSYKLTLGAEYAEGDTITFTYNVNFGPALALPSQLTFNDNTGGNGDTVNFGLLSQTTNSATYRVTGFLDGSTAAGVTTTNLIGVTPTVVLDPAGLINAGTATVTFSAATSGGIALDTTTAPTKDIAKALAEYSVTVGAALNEVVDVNNAKTAFVGQAAGSSADTLTFTTVESNGVAGTTVTKNGAANTATANPTITHASLASSVSTVTGGGGGWSFLDTDATTAGMQLGTNTVTNTHGGSALSWSTDLNSLIITDDATVGAGSSVITKAVETTVIPNQTYTASTVFTYDTNKTVSVTWTPGAWTLNAASVTAYSMPFGSSVGQFLWVTNKGTSTGAITATVTHGGVSSGPYSLGNVGPKTSTYVATLLSDALAADNVVVTGGRANVQIDVTSPTADIVVSAGYKVIADNDRLPVETSDTILNAVTVAGTITDTDDCATVHTTPAENQLQILAAGAAAIKAGTASAAGKITQSIAFGCSAGGGSVTTTTVAK